MSKNLLKSLPQRPQIAIIRLDNIGDHVMGSGFLKGLKHCLPNAIVTLFTSKCSSGLYEHCPYIDRFIVWPQGQDKTNWGRFDLVINPRFAEDYYKAGEFARALGAPKRVAFHQVNEATNAFYTHLVTAPDTHHVAEYANILLHALFGVNLNVVPETWHSEHDLQEARRKLLERGWNSQKPMLVLAPGASEKHRIWPLRHVSRLIKKLNDEQGIQVMIVGSAQEAETWAGLHRGACANKFIDGIGKFTLTELAACFRLTNLFVGTDSGPKHMAAASKLPVIEIGYFPDDWPSLARGMWTSGTCWGPYKAKGESLRPQAAPDLTKEAVYAGKSIAAIPPKTVFSSIQKFWPAK